MKNLINISSLSVVASAIVLSLIFTGCGETDLEHEGNHLPDVNILQNNNTVNVGTKVNLTSTASDVDGDTLTYEWKFVSKPADSLATLTTSSTKEASFTADKAGKYVVQFIAKDIVDAIGKDTVTITAKKVGDISSSSCTSYTEVLGEITSDTTYNGCYKVVGDITVTNNALLTIKPGSTLLFDADSGLHIYGGALKSLGTAKEPILFTAEHKVAGYWKGIKFEDSNYPNNEIGYTTIEYAGNNGRASLFIVDYGNEKPCRLKVHNSTFKYSSSYGFYFPHNAIIDKFENITSTKNTKTAGYVHLSVAEKLDSQSNFTGNLGDDYITISTDGGWINTDMTWKGLSVPYNIPNSFEIDDDATLTIEAGATIIFDSDVGIRIFGGLKAIGTAKEPILFTGRRETPGYWLGLNYFRTNNADNILDYVTLEYGGDNGKAGLYINTNGSDYTRISVTNSIFKDNANYGIFIEEDHFGKVKYNKNIDTVNTFIDNEKGGIGRD